MSDLQQQIDALEDRIFALTGVVNALILALDDAGIPLRERIHRHTARAANELEDSGFPESASELESLRDVVDALLRTPQVARPGTSI